ncbi:nuclear transport factor 2 family protein [Edaphobacter aggregans]|uniref:nuclear transport factor 2 family protein n=1 Tax=Edaphobacter aggregans TaxID=570835 RepID=UPI000557DF7B|nr:nuclear transport factor 2 family protein [Edaphobacter aggregans]
MPRSTEELMKLNLHGVFGERDRAKRLAVISEIWATDGVFIDPEGRHSGYAALDEAVESLLRRFPEFVFVEREPLDAFHGLGRLGWGFGPAGQEPAVTGLDVVVVAGERITALYTFLDKPK